MKVYLEKALNDAIIKTVAGFINKSKLCHGRMFSEEGSDVDFSYLPGNILYVAGNLGNLEDTEEFREVDSEVVIEGVEPFAIPETKISEGLAKEIGNVSKDSTWRRKAWAEIIEMWNTIKDEEIRNFPYTFLIKYIYLEDPENPETEKEGELFINSVITKTENGVEITGSKDGEEVVFINLI
jgi:hypothetical protein